MLERALTLSSQVSGTINTVLVRLETDIYSAFPELIKLVISLTDPDCLYEGKVRGYETPTLVTVYTSIYPIHLSMTKLQRDLSSNISWDSNTYQADLQAYRVWNISSNTKQSFLLKVCKFWKVSLRYIYNFPNLSS